MAGKPPGRSLQSSLRTVNGALGQQNVSTNTKQGQLNRRIPILYESLSPHNITYAPRITLFCKRSQPKLEIFTHTAGPSGATSGEYYAKATSDAKEPLPESFYKNCCI